MRVKFSVIDKRDADYLETYPASLGPHDVESFTFTGHTLYGNTDRGGSLWVQLPELPYGIYGLNCEVIGEAMADTPVQAASVGRIVHYVPDGSREHLAALITGVYEDGVNLTVFDNDSMFRAYAIPHDDGHDCGTWHFPERV